MKNVLNIFLVEGKPTDRSLLKERIKEKVEELCKEFDISINMAGVIFDPTEMNTVTQDGNRIVKNAEELVALAKVNPNAVNLFVRLRPNHFFYGTYKDTLFFQFWDKANELFREENNIHCSMGIYSESFTEEDIENLSMQIAGEIRSLGNVMRILSVLAIQDCIQMEGDFYKLYYEKEQENGNEPVISYSLYSPICMASITIRDHEGIARAIIPYLRLYTLPPM